MTILAAQPFWQACSNFYFFAEGRRTRELDSSSMLPMLLLKKARLSLVPFGWGITWSYRPIELSEMYSRKSRKYTALQFDKFTIVKIVRGHMEQSISQDETGGKRRNRTEFNDDSRDWWDYWSTKMSKINSIIWAFCVTFYADDLWDRSCKLCRNPAIPHPRSHSEFTVSQLLQSKSYQKKKKKKKHPEIVSYVLLAVLYFRPDKFFCVI